MAKGPEAFRTISEAATELGAAQHVLRFWESKFSFIRPMKRAGGRRFYRRQDIDVLRAVQVLIEDRIASPILIGRPGVIESRIKRFGLNLNVETLEIINPEDDPRYRDYVALFLSLIHI